jgi:hypothetical protein
MIATGRSIETIGPTLEKYNLTCGLILMNGAEVRNEEGEILNTINIEDTMIPKLASSLEAMGYIPEYMTNHGAQMCGSKEDMELNMGYRILCLDRNHTLTLEQAIEKGKTSIFMKALTRNESMEKMLQKNLEIRKIIVFHPDIELNKKNREQLGIQYPNLTFLSSYPDNIEINAKYAQKGCGLLEAIKVMGIQKEEVAVFGDGLNDLSMFEQFPNSYAPANAQPAILKKAKEIIPSNNEDGVGKKIFELLYKNKEGKEE